MSGLDLILFDCDGVLVDSEILAAELGSRLLAECGYDISAQSICIRFAGMEWKSILTQIEQESGLSLAARLFDKSNAMLDDILAAKVQEIDGVRGALEQISGPRCICSNSSSARLDLELTKTGLKSYFKPHIFSAMDLGPGRTKPKPDIYLYGASQFDVDPERCLAIEDSVHGVHAARVAGMSVIGFTGGGHTYKAHAERLKEAGADIVFSSMVELPQLVKSYRS